MTDWILRLQGNNTWNSENGLVTFVNYQFVPKKIFQINGRGRESVAGRLCTAECI